jgi:isoquinoline 1-oxidoreductase beta subunit
VKAPHHTRPRIVNAALLPEMTRRGILMGGASLTLAVLVGPLLTACAANGEGGGGAAAAVPLAASPLLRVEPDDSVVIISPNLEMGQGSYTGLATLVAEELDADWSQVRVEGAPADVKHYGNPAFGGAMQGTGGSTTIAAWWEPMRRAGATARAMLVAAAAQHWNVPAAQVTVAAGRVTHAASQRSARFGELAGTAARLPVPTDVKLKDPSAFRLIGQPRPRLDALAKSTGTAQFTQDVKLPDMLVATVILPPRFGATVRRFDATAAKALPGIIDVVSFRTPVREGVAVLAGDFHTSRKARESVKVEWDETHAFMMGSEEIFAQYRALAQQPGLVAHREGDAAAAYAKAERHVSADYRFPFLAHASMEPLNCVAQITAAGCEIWNGEQLQTPDQGAVARLLGIRPEQVKINMLFAGGSFGRRGNPLSDYVLDAVAIARAGGRGKPVKMVWAREDDMHAGFYRPAYYHALKAGLDQAGRIISWQHRIVGQSIMAGTPMDDHAPIDSSSVEGAAAIPYSIPNQQVELHTTQIGVPIQWWRSVGSTHTAYAVECFIDDLARSTHQDPVEFRRAMLDKHPRHLAVLNAAADRAGWGTTLPAGTARGVALHESFNTIVAEVVEVSRHGKDFKVDRVVCVVDCGTAVNPNIVAMQMESAIAFGLSAAATGAITLQEGRVQQSNFNDYTVLRLNQMPKVEVHILPSTRKPTGVGEPGTPPIAPAVANALAALTGRTYHELPFSRAEVNFI